MLLFAAFAGLILLVSAYTLLRGCGVLDGSLVSEEKKEKGHSLGPWTFTRREAGTAKDLLRPVPALALAAGQQPPTPWPLSLNGTGTFATWFKPDASSSSVQCIACLGRHWALALRQDSSLAFVRRDDKGEPSEFIPLYTAPLAAWTHIIVSFSGMNTTIYLNGSSTPVAARFSEDWLVVEMSGSSRLQLGDCSEFRVSGTGPSSQLRGWLAGTLVLDRAITNADVASVLERRLPLSGAVFSIESLAAADLMVIPTLPTQRRLADQYTPNKTCAIPSPNEAAYLSVPKTPSVTVMAWLKLGQVPLDKEACILSHGSWQQGWKLSITPHANFQFSAHTQDIHAWNYFAQKTDTHKAWEHVAVTYHGPTAKVQFYVNGDPVDPEHFPENLVGDNRNLVLEEAPLTVGRCRAEDDTDEKLHGTVADVVIFSGVLEVDDIRKVLREGFPAAEADLQKRDATTRVVFATNAVGCPFKQVDEPSLPKPAELKNATKTKQ